MDIRPIRTEEDYNWAVNEIEELINAEPGTPEFDKLEVLVILVEAYEDEHDPIALPDPIEAIKYWMESRGLSRTDLEPYIGSRGRVAEILNRVRPLSLRMIRNLENNLGIPAEILVQEYPLADQSVEENLSIEININTKLRYEDIIIVSDSATTEGNKELPYFRREQQQFLYSRIIETGSQETTSKVQSGLTTSLIDVENVSYSLNNISLSA